MNWYRIFALVQKNFILTYRGLDPLVDIFYWPLYDIILWGFTSLWVTRLKNTSISLTWLTALCIWQVCYRVNLDVSLNLLVELWSRNMVNLFATPLEIKEWIVAAMCLGFINAVITTIFGTAAVAVLYGINVFSVGWIFFLLLLILMLSGWAIGFFSAGCIIKEGQKAQKLVWVLGWFFVPFSALFYPLTLLPTWAVMFSKVVPMSYVFEGLRVYAAQGTYPLYNLGMALLLNCIYLTLSLTFFVSMFYRSKTQGLARLDTE